MRLAVFLNVALGLDWQESGELPVGSMLPAVFVVVGLV